METLKIAFLSYMGRYSTPPVNYGGEIIYANIVDELDKMGHEITLYATPNSMIPKHGRLVEHSSIDEHGFLNPYLEHDFVLKHWDEIRRHDIIHDASNFKFAHYYSDVYHIANKSLTHLISNDFVNLYQPYHIVCISWKHTQLALTSSSSYDKEPIPHPVFHKANYLVNVTNPVWIYPDIDLQLYKPRYDKEDYVAWVSRFVPEKGPIQAIEACVKAGVKLKMSGSIWAPDHNKYFTEKVKPLMDKYNIEYVKTEDRQSLIEFLQGAKALIFDVQYNESFGYVALEALACGTPVLATCNGALPEIIEHGKSGFIVPNSVDAFAKYIKKIYKLRPQDARQRATKFAKPKGANEFYKLYKDMLNGKWPTLDLPFILK
jgi:glycosyltransferase involved in cell wall biosynthesis